jgi:steroid 5-alpha reductase family enzyme
MSLKAFHIVFITVSVLLLLFLSGWAFSNSRQGGGAMDAVWGSLALATAAALAVYGQRFLKRLKHISFL